MDAVRDTDAIPVEASCSTSAILGEEMNLQVLSYFLNKTCCGRFVGFCLASLGLFLPTSAVAQSHGCPNSASAWDFYVAVNGNVTDSGRTKEGPMCVRIHFNRLRFNLAANFDTTQRKGVDPSSVLLPGSLPRAAPVAR